MFQAACLRNCIGQIKPCGYLWWIEKIALGQAMWLVVCLSMFEHLLSLHSSLGAATCMFARELGGFDVFGCKLDFDASIFAAA